MEQEPASRRSERAPLHPPGESAQPASSSAYQTFDVAPTARSNSQEMNSQGRRGSFGDRQQFQAARQNVVRDAVLNGDTLRSPQGVLFMILGGIILSIPAVIIIYIEVRSWYVLFAYGGQPCDQDLVFWLIVRNVMSITAPRMPSPDEPDLDRAERQRRHARVATVIWIVWLIVGFLWTGQCKSCQETNPQLYNWVRFLTVFGLWLHLLSILFPFLVLLCAMLYHAMVGRGWIKSPNAARDSAIEEMQKVEFKEGVFGGEGPDDPPSECCCCMDEFDAEKGIVCTPCNHYFHHVCLKEWLKMAKTCPLCRNDLDREQQPRADLP